MAEETVYKYVIASWTLGARIDKVRLVKETAQLVTVLDRFEAEDRFKKQGRAFKTWEEAHQELLRRAEVDVANSERRLKGARQTLLEIQAMESGGDKCH